MKRFKLCQVLVFALAVTAVSVSLGDSKNRSGSFSGNHGSGNNQSSNNGNSFRSRIGQNNNNNSHSNKVTHHESSSGGNLTNNSLSGGFRRPRVEHHEGNNISNNNFHNSVIGNHFGNREHHEKKPNVTVTLPPNLQHQIGNAIQNPHRFPNTHQGNGTKIKHVPVDLSNILHHNVNQHPGNQHHNQPQIQHVVAHAPKHLMTQPHFNWWVTICHHHCNTHYGNWNVTQDYWNTWTPCNWHVVQCQQLSYYVGLTCIHIPDMQAYGVQSVIEGSPAHQGGLQKGDLIVSVNGQTVLDPNLVNTEVPRGRLELVVIREGSPEPVSLIVIPRLVQVVSY